MSERVPVMWNGYQIGWATKVPGTDGFSVRLFGRDEVNEEYREIVERITLEAMGGLSIG